MSHPARRVHRLVSEFLLILLEAVAGESANTVAVGAEFESEDRGAK